MSMSIPNYHLTHITSFTIDWINGEKLGSIQQISFTAQITHNSLQYSFKLILNQHCGLKVLYKARPT